MAQDYNLNLDTEKVDLIKINVKLEKDKKGNEQKDLKSMTKRTIKREIGLVYLLIVVSIYLGFSNLSKIIPPKLLTCFNWAFFGITCKALIYYQFKRTGQDELLKKNEAVGTITSYFLYGIASLAVVCLIYLTFFNTFEHEAFSKYFFWIAMFLFSYIGFAITEVRKRFLGGD